MKHRSKTAGIVKGGSEREKLKGREKGSGRPSREDGEGRRD